MSQENEPIHVITVGDQVVAEVAVAGAGRVSGIAPIGERITLVATFRDGLIIRQETFRSRAAALEAVGLSE
jgi:ketosteroid isomerase-like protein